MLPLPDGHRSGHAVQLIYTVHDAFVGHVRLLITRGNRLRSHGGHFVSGCHRDRGSSRT